MHSIRGGGGPVVSLLSERKKNGETPSKQLDEIHAQISQNAKAPKGIRSMHAKTPRGAQMAQPITTPKTAPHSDYGQPMGRGPVGKTASCLPLQSFFVLFGVFTHKSRIAHK